MTPVRLTPRLLEKVWGSTTLEPWFPNQKNKTGEVWFEGVPNLPLLIKLLFTSEKLSVQVHPGDAHALLYHGSRGKTEMWHILRAEPGAQIAAGFRREITEEELHESARSGEIMDLLEWHDAHDRGASTVESCARLAEAHPEYAEEIWGVQIAADN